MFKFMKKMRSACVNASFTMAILIGLILFKRFAVRVRIDVTKIESA